MFTDLLPGNGHPAVVRVCFCGNVLTESLPSNGSHVTIWNWGPFLSKVGAKIVGSVTGTEMLKSAKCPRGTTLNSSMGSIWSSVLQQKFLCKVFLQYRELWQSFM
jgi:hypothetical protein